MTSNKIWNWLKTHERKLTRLFGYISIFIIIGFYGWQIYKGGFKFEWQDYRFVWSYLIGALILHALGLVYGSLGWAVIMQAVAQREDLLKSAKIYYLTTITRNLPGFILHATARAYMHQEKGSGKAITLLAVLVELLITATASAIAYLVTTYVFIGQIILPIYYPALVVLGALILFYPPVFKRLVSRIPGYQDQTQTAANITINRMIYLVFLYFVIIVLGGIILFYTINAVYALSVSYLPTVIGVWAITIMINVFTFWIPGSVRIRDATMLVILSNLITPALALIVTFVWRYLLMFSDFLWGSIVWFVMWLKGDVLIIETKKIFNKFSSKNVASSKPKP